MIGFTSGKHRVIYKIHFFPGSVLFLLLLVEKKNGTLHILKVWPPKRASPPTPRFTQHRIIYRTHFFSGSVLFLLLFVEKKKRYTAYSQGTTPKKGLTPNPKIYGTSGPSALQTLSSRFSLCTRKTSQNFRGEDESEISLLDLYSPVLMSANIRSDACPWMSKKL